MDKSGNNFDDVDDTMSSVYNAWRKKLLRNILIAIKKEKKIYTQISLSVSLTLLSVISMRFLYIYIFIYSPLFFRNLLNLDNFEQ